uniref:Uncharacterized protein n=1 Tax=Romanomermis culicivorax TaxID=13658 RepID=A0A915JQC4_ROMCU
MKRKKSNTLHEVDINEKRKDFRCKLLILNNSADSLLRNQIDKYESMLDGIENRQNQLRSKQSCTVARDISNKNLQAQRRFLTKRKSSIAKKQHLKKPMVENKKIIYT